MWKGRLEKGIGSSGLPQRGGGRGPREWNERTSGNWKVGKKGKKKRGDAALQLGFDLRVRGQLTSCLGS